MAVVLVAHDEEAFGGAVSRLLQSDDLRRRMGLQARVTARQYSIYTTTRRLAEIYGGVISCRSNSGC